MSPWLYGKGGREECHFCECLQSFVIFYPSHLSWSYKHWLVMLGWEHNSSANKLQCPVNGRIVYMSTVIIGGRCQQGQDWFLATHSRKIFGWAEENISAEQLRNYLFCCHAQNNSPSSSSILYSYFSCSSDKPRMTHVTRTCLTQQSKESMFAKSYPYKELGEFGILTSRINN